MTYMYMCMYLKEKKREIWLSPMTEAPIRTENSTTNWQHNNATKNSDYTTTALRRSVGVTHAIQMVWFNRFTGT